MITIEQLAELLCTTKGNIVKMKSEGTLEDFANKCGYTITKCKKFGKKLLFETDDYNNLTNNPEYYIKTVYGINNIDKFIEYFKMRTNDNINVVNTSAYSISNKLGVSEKTIYEWDEKLLTLGILTHAGYNYIEKTEVKTPKENDKYSVDVKNEYLIITEEKYKKYWFRNYKAKEKKFIDDEFKTGKIDLDKFYSQDDFCGNCLKLTKDRYCYRIKKYTINKDYFLYKDTLTAISLKEVV
jgi:hypothetical protein